MQTVHDRNKNMMCYKGAMQCVIIAAGAGTRMRPLTENTPKPLLKVCGKPILDHIIEALPEVIDEIILVVNYKKEQIYEHCGEEYLGRRITYCEQADPKAGTGDALRAAKNAVRDRFLFMYGDDIHGPSALAEAVTRAHCMLAARAEEPQKFGVIELNDDNTLRGIVEKPEQPPTNLVNIGGWVLTPEIFSYDVPLSHLGEYLLTDAISAYAQDYPVEVVEQDMWIPIGYPEDIKKAESMLCP